MDTAAKRPTDDPLFDRVWAIRPRRPNDSKMAAKRAWDARRKEGVDPQEMLQGVERYAAYLKAERTEPRFIKHLATFLGPNHHFQNDFSTDAQPEGETMDERQLLLYYEQEPLV